MSQHITQADEPVFEKIRKIDVDELRNAVLDPQKKLKLLSDAGVTETDLDRYLQADRRSVIMAQHSCC